jgi:serine/threonine-protein kinase
VADVVIFSGLDLGAAALDAFNRFGNDDVTGEIPAILLLDQKQQHFAREAQLAPHRQTISMPLKVKDLRAMLMKLLSQVA